MLFMTLETLDFIEAYDWLIRENKNKNKEPHLLLGNGFSVAFDYETFSYGALLDYATEEKLLGPLSAKFFQSMETHDFEAVINRLLDAALALEVIDRDGNQAQVEALRDEAEILKEILAKSLASLHPERPSDVDDSAYLRVKNFLGKHAKIYTANYDLLLYWTIMKDSPNEVSVSRDDGFRSPDQESKYVVWDHLTPYRQNVHYLHGALHLYRARQSAELQKLTWIRTDEALIDQIRSQLHSNRFPLIVTEGTSNEKLAKIQTSDYMAKGLRSLASLGGGMVVFGLSFSPNDDHIAEAIVKSGISSLAVSLFGSTTSAENQETIRAVNRMVADRSSVNAKKPIEVKFYDASSVPLW